MIVNKSSAHPQHIFVIGFFVLSFLFLRGTVFGVGRPEAVGSNPTSYGAPVTGGQPGSTTQFGRPSGTPGQQGLNRLTESRLRACQGKEKAMSERMTHLVQLVTTMESKFDAIAKAVEDYYTKTVVPSGKTVANYDALVNDVATSKAAVATTVATAQTDGTGFTCTGDDPKGQLTQFRTDMQAVLRALQDYRVSVKNLIVAVRSVTGVTESMDNSNNPNISGKPSVSPNSNDTGSQKGNQ